METAVSDPAAAKADSRTLSQKRMDLEERTLTFATDVRTFVTKLPRAMAQSHDVVELLHASAAVGAEYIEANEALGRKDFVLNIRTCLKEAKEAHFWLRILPVGSSDRLRKEKDRLAEDAKTLLKIFFGILRTIRTKNKVAVAA